MCRPFWIAWKDTILGKLDPRRAPFIFGLCGPQGSGKSTAALALKQRLEGRGLRALVLSLYDLYLSRDDRRRLAADVHPLLATRGPPGTHDVALGLDVISALKARRPVRLPLFHKATDDRCPLADWPAADRDADVIILVRRCPRPARRRASSTRERLGTRRGQRPAVANMDKRATCDSLSSAFRSD